MSKRGVLGIALKLFGIYSAIRAIESIPTLGMAAATYNSEHVINPYLYFGSAAFIPFLYICLAAIFFLKRGWIVDLICGASTHADPVQEENSASGSLTLWVRVIGLYYFVMASGSLISHISQLGNRGFYWWTPVITKAAILCISIWFIFRTSSVVTIIETKSK